MGYRIQDGMLERAAQSPMQDGDKGGYRGGQVRPGFHGSTTAPAFCVAGPSGQDDSVIEAVAQADHAGVGNLIGAAGADDLVGQQGPFRQGQVVFHFDSVDLTGHGLKLDGLASAVLLNPDDSECAGRLGRVSSGIKLLEIGEPVAIRIAVRTGLPIRRGAAAAEVGLAPEIGDAVANTVGHRQRG